MDKPSATNTAQRTSKLQLLIGAASLLLNVSLAVHLLKGRPESPVSPGAIAGSGLTEEPITNKTPELKTESTETTVTPNNEAVLHWSEIESSDLRQYIANLRATGCPEQIIRDIILADVSQLYSKRAQAIWQRPESQYWQKYKDEKPSAAQGKELGALRKEQQTLLKDLLGGDVSQQNLINLLFLQVVGSERETLYLPTERRDAVLKALADADLDSKELSGGGDYFKKEQKRFDEKLKLLADVLTPEELDEYHLRNSPMGNLLKSEVRYFNLTQDEYKQLLVAKESGDGRTGTADTVRKLFGDERAKEFERVSSGYYINARTGAEAEGISMDRVEQAAKIANDSTTAGFTAANDRSLSVEDRKAKMKEIQSQAETQIKGLLGDKASKLVLRDIRNVLQSSANTMRP